MRSKLILLPIIVALLVFPVSAVWAQQGWEGSAIVGRYGEFPPGGLYAASNAFPLNSIIEVTNPDTGRTQRLIVAQRAENPGVLLVVSQTAAEELGVSRSATFRVQVEPVEMPPLTSVPPSEDLPFHPDPDINPRAAVGDPNAALLQPGVPGVPEAAAEAAEAPSEEPELAESAAEEPEVAEAPPEGPEVRAEESTEEPEAIAEADEAPEEAPADVPEPDPETIPAPGVGPGPPSVTVLPEAEPGPEKETPGGVEGPEVEEPEEAPVIAEEPEGPGEKDLFPPAPEDELYAALATPARPEEEAVVTELPMTLVDEAVEVEADTLGPQFPNPVELTVTLPEPPAVETPEATDLAPPRPEERAPTGELAMAAPGEAAGPDMSEELAERPDRPEGPVTEIPLRIVEAIEPPKAEEERITRPTREPGEEVVSLEPAEFRPPEPPEPEGEESLTPEERPEGQPEEPRLTEAPEPPGEAPAESRPMPAERPAGRTGVAAAEPEASPDRGELPLTSRLSEEGYYLQVGAFSDPQGAQAAVTRLGADFPVKVVPSAGDIYRVYVGPLEEDERGAVLYLVRARGYRDAFLRSSSDG